VIGRKPRSGKQEALTETTITRRGGEKHEPGSSKQEEVGEKNPAKEAEETVPPEKRV